MRENMEKVKYIFLIVILLLLGLFLFYQVSLKTTGQSREENIEVSQSIEKADATAQNTAILGEEEPQSTPYPESEQEPEPTIAVTVEPTFTPAPEMEITEEFEIELKETEDVGGF